MASDKRPQSQQVIEQPANSVDISSERIRRLRGTVITGRKPQGPRMSTRPVSPNIQIYRPQLTSVLSIVNRITGAILSLGAVMLVGWLVAAASGPATYGAIQNVLASRVGLLFLFGFTLAFFLHLCGGIRHLLWDTVHGFTLHAIYLGGWLVVAASVTLTIAAWTAGLLMAG